MKTIVQLQATSIDTTSVTGVVKFTFNNLGSPARVLGFWMWVSTTGVSGLSASSPLQFMVEQDLLAAYYIGKLQPYTVEDAIDFVAVMDLPLPETLQNMDIKVNIGSLPFPPSNANLSHNLVVEVGR